MIYDFKERGLSMVGIARKYGVSKLFVEDLIRLVMIRQRNLIALMA